MNPAMELFKTYFNVGLKPLRCAGYNPESNREKDTEKKYRRAKEAIDKGFTKDNYKGLTISEIESWEKTGGWIGWVIPKGYIAIDVEDPEAIRYIEDLCKQKGIRPSVHITNRGKHFFFEYSGNLSASSKDFTKSGLKVTYRVGGKNYLILAPTNNRAWEVPLNE
jgi:hypothetical protein